MVEKTYIRDNEAIRLVLVMHTRLYAFAAAIAEIYIRVCVYIIYNM